MNLKLLIREQDIRITELADTFGISRQTLYNYISLYEEGKKNELPSTIRSVFDYICDVDFTTINNIKAIFGGADPTKEYGEDNPLLWCSRVFVKTKNLFPMLKEVRRNGHPASKEDDGSYRFNITKGNNDVRFVVYDRAALTPELVIKCKEAESFEDINKLFNEEVRLSYESFKTGTKIRDKSEYDIPPWDEEFNEDNESVDYTNLEPKWFEHELLKKEIIDKLREQKAYSPSDVAKLRKIENLLIADTPEFEIVFKGNVTSVIKLKDSGNYALCYCTTISDQTVPPKYENHLYSGDRLFYKICEGGEELIRLCDCIETSAMRIEYK